LFNFLINSLYDGKIMESKNKKHAVSSQEHRRVNI
jgi:hypothetical protein